MALAALHRSLCAAARTVAVSSSRLSNTMASLADAKDSGSGCIDAKQAALLEEPCLLVDERDKRIGTASKRECHTWRAGTCPLHRAFSVFLFNSQNQLLLQQRSNAKITFPGYYTNTCCSHPLAVPGEEMEQEGLGVINAARRRLHLELGIDPEEVPVSKFRYLTRILYKSPSGDGVWGEHEIDYILIVRADVQLRPDPNEVRAVQYVSQDALAGFLSKLRTDEVPLTPWFQLVCDSFLHRWWQNLDHLEQFVDHTNIHRG